MDNGNLYTTFKTASYNDGSTTITDVSAIQTALGSLPENVDNTEHLYSAYAVNGNTLTLTPTGASSPENFTKQ